MADLILTDLIYSLFQLQAYVCDQLENISVAPSTMTFFRCRDQPPLRSSLVRRREFQKTLEKMFEIA